jgi:hypothetical protein
VDRRVFENKGTTVAAGSGKGMILLLAIGYFDGSYRSFVVSPDEPSLLFPWGMGGVDGS